MAYLIIGYLAGVAVTMLFLVWTLRREGPLNGAEWVVTAIFSVGWPVFLTWLFWDAVIFSMFGKEQLP